MRGERREEKGGEAEERGGSKQKNPGAVYLRIAGSGQRRSDRRRRAAAAAIESSVTLICTGTGDGGAEGGGGGNNETKCARASAGGSMPSRHNPYYKYCPKRRSLPILELYLSICLARASRSSYFFRSAFLNPR